MSAVLLCRLQTLLQTAASSIADAFVVLKCECIMCIALLLPSMRNPPYETHAYMPNTTLATCDHNGDQQGTPAHVNINMCIGTA
jgi:hypothetical protein